MLELRQGLSVSTKSLEDDSLKLFCFERAGIVHTELIPERCCNLTPELNRFVEPTGPLQELSNFTLGIHGQRRVATAVTERPTQRCLGRSKCRLWVGVHLLRRTLGRLGHPAP